MILTPELEKQIAAKVRNDDYPSPAEVVRAGLELLEAKDGGVPAPADALPPQDTRPIWEIIVELGEQIPEEELDKIPTDLSRNYKHYLYGAPRRES